MANRSMPHIAILTAGGAGMFCGSCMHDNTWARALHAAGVPVSLVPTYTPIRVDEESQASQRVFFGGLNVYLNHKSRWWRALPQWSKRWLDRPALISWATRFGVSNDAKELGEMTLAMLAGEHGPQRVAGEELASYIRGLQPNFLVFTNSLLAGVLPQIRSVFRDGTILCTLQGDDIFLEGLPAAYREKVLTAIREKLGLFDGFLVHSEYYARFMVSYLGIPREKIHLLPLTIDTSHHTGTPEPTTLNASTVGYFARICPEKGFHHFAKAALVLGRARPDVQFLAGGYLGPQHRAFFEETMELVKPLGQRFQYRGSPETHAEKVALLNGFDVFSVPTDYHEPKGLYVLEALANGRPVVQPAIGAFPELIESTGGGITFPPGDATACAAAWEQLLNDNALRTRLAVNGHTAVHAHHGLAGLAAATTKLFSTLSGQCKTNELAVSEFVRNPNPEFVGGQRFNSHLQGEN